MIFVRRCIVDDENISRASTIRFEEVVFTLYWGTLALWNFSLQGSLGPYF